MTAEIDDSRAHAPHNRGRLGVARNSPRRSENVRTISLRAVEAQRALNHGQ
jgi:hypothetical protein